MILIARDYGDNWRSQSVTDREDAKYYIQRWVEKEGWEATEAYLLDESQELPAKEWVKEHHEEVFKSESKARESEEKATFERLKKKYEGK